MRLISALLLVLFLAALNPVWPAMAQTTDDNTAIDDGEEDDEDAPADPSDDVFLPSEEIKADTEISFPSDI